jgi:DNA-binding winged helix-turn-helix (wHTH) protein/predicted ATPase/KaiC/GvpD/RAD55 family RecA-like ATPase
MQTAKDITFGRFRLDLTNECLWQDTRAISLRPKAFAVLRLLLEHPGQLVSKQQVMDTVWPGTFVGDAVLKDNIRQLREAMNDDAGSPSYIETAHRRGYRFICKLSEAARGKSSGDDIKGGPSPPVSQIAALPSRVTAKTVLGRDAELAKLRSWLERVLEGERQTIFVTGEPGIGKTTIVQAFLEQAGQVPGILVARGQCLGHYGAGEAYLPILDGFSRLCRSPRGAQVTELLRQQAPAWLAQMSSLVSQSERDQLHKQAAGATRERMLREMAEAIETLTLQSPLLLVLEDLHWSDYSTLDLLSYLARRRDPARLMVIGTYRPVDVIVGEHPLKGVKRELQAHGLCHELPLEYLSKGVIKEYLAARFPGHEFPLQLRRTICRRTGGNPLFIVNLVDYLEDQKVIVEDQETWKLRVGISEVEQEVPINLRQLIETQIERLSPDERTVLEGASVAGLECSCVAIAAGLDMPIAWVEKHCEELARRHQFLSPAWLVELPDGTITPRHRFIHVLYRDVPYRLIPAMRRSQIHQRIAERGVVIYGSRKSEIAAELAMHFEQSRDWPRALEYLSQAAENAAAHSAHHEATDLATRGLEALRFLPESAERAQQEIKLRMTLGVSLMATKGFASAEAEVVNARSRELFLLRGPSPELFFMLWSLGLYYQFGGELRSSLRISDQLVQLAEELRDGALIMEAHRSQGGALVLLGRYAEGLEHLVKAAALYSVHRDHRYRAFIGRDCKVICDGFAAMALWALGYPDRSAERMRESLRLARELGHPQTLIAAWHFAAQIHQLRGESELVEECAKEVAELAEEYGLELWLAYGCIELGWVESEMGNAQRGIEQLQRGLAAYEATGAKLWSPYFLGLLADQMAKAGRVEEGLATIEKALTQSENSGDGYSLPELHRVKGQLILRRDSIAEGGHINSPAVQARACFAEALAVARRQQARSWELRALISMDRVDSEGTQLHEELAACYSSFTEGFETADLKRARTQLTSVSLT